jgi:outer membrane protein insertion porin family
MGGRGQMLKIRGQLGQRRTLGLITFRDPYLRDSLTSGQLDIYSSLTNYVTYSEDKSGVSLTFGRWFSEYTSGSFALIGEALNFKDPQSDSPEFILRQIGSQTTTGFRSSLARDSRDFYMDPRSGMRNAVNFDLGTPYLGGTNNFAKFTLDTIKYWPLPFDLRHSLRGRIGTANGLGGKPIPLTERYFVGGISTMRGFVFGRAGPVTSSGSLVGAAHQMIVNYDFIFPISTEAKLNGVVFFDYGAGFDDNQKINFDTFRKAAGIEGRWISPFGPLRAAYGLNLEPRPGEKKSVFEFSVGSLF